jgi:hypothetical protein
MPLRAKKPETIEKRLKMMLYGPAGVGKTTAAIQFPSSYIIDMEKGCDHYASTIQGSQSVLFQTTNPDDVKQELKTLLTEKHEFKTLVLDPITILYGALQEKWTRLFEQYTNSTKSSDLQDFGPRFWARVKSEYKSIVRMLLALDMNVIVVSHQKDLWGEDMKKLGTGPDSMRGDDYIFDYVFQLTKDGTGKRMAVTKKERAEIGKTKFPETFAWDYKNFLAFYGQEQLERSATPVQLATADQVAALTHLLSVVKVDDDFQEKAFTKYDVDSWDELTQEQIQKAIDYLNKKLTAK